MDIHHRDESKRGPEKCCRLSESDIRARVVKALDEHLGIPVAGDAASENIDLVNVDSLTAVELSTSLSQAFDHPLPAALLFDYPSIPSLVEHLVRTLGANDLQTAAQQLSTLKAPVEEAARGTIVAMLHTRIPHANAEDAVSTTPLQRWRPAYADSLPVPFGAWLSDVDMFDSMAFGISPNEAIVMDPQHRALVEMVSESTAGTPVGRDGDRHIGVYVGIQHAEYISLYNAYVGEMKSNAFAATSSAFSVAAGRISYIFGLQGPAMSLDTACSSAFSALHVAREDLVNCRTRRTICCAVNMMLSEKTTRSTTTSGMLSREGRCKALDAAADGYVRGEAVACLVMEIEGIHEYGEGALARRIVIDASNVNQDGRTSTLTAPNGPSQQRVIAGAMATALLDPREVCSLHMHGTGTSLGDPIEFGSLVSIFKGTLAGKSLSASKSIRGHAEPASGLVGMASASAQLHHAKLAPMQHLRPDERIHRQRYAGRQWPTFHWPLASARRRWPPDLTASARSPSREPMPTLSSRDGLGNQLGSVALNPQMWRMARMWFGVRPNHMLTACKRADASTGPVVFSCQPATRKTLHDHVVSGKIILPGYRHAGNFCSSGRGALPARCAGGGRRPVPGGRPRRHPTRRHPRQKWPIRYRARCFGGARIDRTAGSRRGARRRGVVLDGWPRRACGEEASDEGEALPAIHRRGRKSIRNPLPIYRRGVFPGGTGPCLIFGPRWRVGGRLPHGAGARRRCHARSGGWTVPGPIDTVFALHDRFRRDIFDE